ncbi:MAG: DUF4058 family protein [Chloroflexota bacterium]|nr:DUF4058 family protein [Chloroflexota bacterium]
MAIRAVKNQYAGINAHLHSHWQASGGWHEFHSLYLANLYTLLKPAALKLGYTVSLEPSIQIRRLDDQAGVIHEPESDLTIYDLDALRALKSPVAPVVAAAGELVLSAEVVLRSGLSAKTYDALKVYDVRAKRGSPVCWIELLSPSNKPNGSDWRKYQAKRQEIVESGIVFLEIDYLHESPSTVSVLPPYLFRGDVAPEYAPHPYRIIIVDPRIDSGVVRLRGFDVDEAIPLMQLQLNGDDQMTLDFDSPYHKTIAEGLFAFEFVDYATLPVNFNHYREADKTRIVNRMLTVIQAARSGHDLESAALQPTQLALEEALSLLHS